MAHTTPITYLFDPLCGWCYGASPALTDLAARPGFTLVLAPTGLFSGEGARPMDAGFAAYAWSNDQRIGRLTGQRFSDDYRSKILGDRSRLFDSGPATLALTAVSLSEPARELDTLKAIQEARYVDARDVTDRAVLAAILQGLGLKDAAERIASPDDSLLAANRQRVTAAQDDMWRFGLDGVPALLTGEGERRRALRASALFGGIDALIDGLRAA
jgi:putative protein-disulfide isomerase